MYPVTFVTYTPSFMIRNTTDGHMIPLHFGANRRRETVEDQVLEEWPTILIALAPKMIFLLLPLLLISKRMSKNVV